MEDIEKKYEWGIFLARTQPLHNGHVMFIEHMSFECKNILIINGSSNKHGTMRNPFSTRDRLRWIDYWLNTQKSNIDFSKCNVELISLPDWSTEKDSEKIQEWGRYLYYNIVGKINCKNFAFYYGDNPEIIKDWFSEELKDRVEIVKMDRLTMTHGLCATQVREALLRNDKDFIYNNCPKNVYDDFSYMRKTWLSVINNPLNELDQEMK